MALVVQKYGGTSVGTTDRIKNVAKRIIKTYEAGNEVVVVVSAMSGETNKLVALANEMMEIPDNREYDVVVATGEQDEQGCAFLAEVDAVTRAVIDTHLRDATADGLHVAGKPEGEAKNPRLDAGVGPRIFQAIQPSLKFRGLADLAHGYMVA